VLESSTPESAIEREEEPAANEAEEAAKRD